MAGMSRQQIRDRFAARVAAREPLVIGGAGWLYGGIAGAIAFKLMQDALSAATPQYWTFWIGLILVILVLVLFSYAAWWCWWLGGAFGHRGFVDYYAFLAVPLAWTLAQFVSARWWVRVPGLVFVALTLALNLRMTERYEWFWSEPEWTWARLAAEWSSLF